LSSNNSSILNIESIMKVERGGSVTDRQWIRKEGLGVLGGGHRKAVALDSKGFVRKLGKNNINVSEVGAGAGRGHGNHCLKKSGSGGQGKCKVGKILNKTMDDSPSPKRPLEESEVVAAGKEGPTRRFEERSLKKIRD
jgi:hypothetical protein